MQSTFSPSSLSCFEKCPKQYWFRYVEKLPVDTEGIEAFVGKRVHEVLERLYQFALEGLVPSLERVLYRYHANFEAAFDADRIRIARAGTDIELYRRNGSRCLENYYRRHYPFDADETIGIERKIGFRLGGDPAYRLRGIIDRVVRRRDGTLEIHDFKTGRRVPKQEELDRDRQLGLYELGLRDELGESGPVRLVWHYLLPNQVRHSERDEAQREQLRLETREIIDRIRREDTWKAKTSALCGWCEFREHCPAVQTAELAPEEPMPREIAPPALEEAPVPSEPVAPSLEAPPREPATAEPAAADGETAANAGDGQLSLL